MKNRKKKPIVTCNPLRHVFIDVAYWSVEIRWHLKYYNAYHWVKHLYNSLRRRQWQPTPVLLPGESQGRGAWWAAVYGVAQSRTRLKRLSSGSSSSLTVWTVIQLSVNSTLKLGVSSVQFSRSVMSDSCNPMNRGTPGLPVHHQLPESTQTPVHRVSDAI